MFFVFLILGFRSDNKQLSDCLGGQFGNKWTDVAREWNERSEVHSVRQCVLHFCAFECCLWVSRNYSVFNFITVLLTI